MRVERTVCVILLKLVVMSLSHRKRLSGRMSKSVVRTSDASRWVSLCWVQVRYSWRMVCRLFSWSRRMVLSLFALSRAD